MLNNSLFSVFEINVTLTCTGVANWITVVTIVYEYIHMLRTEGPQKWIFEELQQIAQIEYGEILCICTLSVIFSSLRLHGRSGGG